ncbi:NADPH-dependent F420 reductase [Arthrobacter sp. 35W]|uniref:NADPH-dependent F420 reductase n=1 Tax=Arthrobacter sp. 35W TaxID=1132441 RepID=UPI0004134094|nr:NAD(P)-binding domain-containing protein [Arthrobacter sp. 35W]
MTSIGILGAGRVGTAIARTALKSGHTVDIAASGPAAEIEMLVDIVVPGARATSALEAAGGADVVVLAVPLHKYKSVDAGSLAGKIVVDTMNYWAPIDGRLDDFDGGPSSSEVVAAHFAGARVVKTLNHIGYHELETDTRPAGTPGRRAVAVASDDAEAAAVVMELIEGFGYDAVYSGPLATGCGFGPGTAIFGGPQTAEQINGHLGLAAASR